MNRAEATTALRQDSTLYCELVHRDTTGQWFEMHPCWIDSDGDLVYPHPTDRNRGPVMAPEDGNYQLTERNL